MGELDRLSAGKIFGAYFVERARHWSAAERECWSSESREMSQCFLSSQEERLNYYGKILDPREELI